MSSISTELPLNGTSLEILNYYYDTVVSDLMSIYGPESSLNPYVQMTLSRFKTVINYNVPDGKKIRGTLVIDTVRVLSSSLNEDLYKKASIVAWCIELMQSAFLVTDDFMDHSLTRRGKQCWYLKTREKEHSINDSFYLYSCTFILLLKYCPESLQIYKLFNETFQRTVIGQSLDVESESYFPTIDLYTEDYYFTVIQWKTAYYTIYLPVLCGILLTPAEHHISTNVELEKVLLDIGCYFQVQDDFLDCYGDINITGKIGTDIQEKKCSWLIVQAMKKCNNNDRQVLIDNYGQDNLDNVNKVKDIYKKLDLSNEYKQYAQKTYADIMERIDKNFQQSKILIVLKKILNSIHERSK